MDKRGYIKTVEAVIAIVAVLIFVVTTVPNRSLEDSGVPPIVKSSQEFITTEISTNEEIRECVIENPLCENADIMKQIIENNLPNGYDYTFKICNTSNCLTTTPLDRSVYLTDVFITSTIEEQNPKIVRIWILFLIPS